MQVTFDPQGFKAGCLNRAWNKLVKWMSNHFLELSCINKMTPYSSLGHSSAPVQFSDTSLNCTNQSTRGEIAPPIRAYNKGGTLINNSTV